MARTDYVADMEALLTRQLADAERQMEALARQRRTGAAPHTPLPDLGDTERARQGGATRGVAPTTAPPAQAPGAVAPMPQQTSLDELDERIMRLQQLREWLKDDNLRGMIDDVINRHVRTAERRQAFFSAGVGVASLIAGWLLSAISPAGVLLNLFHQ